MIARLLLLISALSLLGGCKSLQPWVKPYERAALAEEVMSTDRNPTIDEYNLHVHEVREASHGATGSSGGGCGCN